MKPLICKAMLEAEQRAVILIILGRYLAERSTIDGSCGRIDSLLISRLIQNLINKIMT